MKCPMCDGTGTSNTCVNGTFKPCSFCDGTGEFDPNEVDRFNAVDVIKVMEMVKKPMTNEEWLHTLNTEQLAEFLWNYTHDIIFDYERIRNPILREMPLKNILGDNCTKKGAWVEWLKQPHKE